jgi:hypothetical protein
MPAIGNAPKGSTAAPRKGPPAKPGKPAAQAAGDEHGTKDIASALEEMDSAWSETPAKEGGFEKLPAGKYQVQITKTGVEFSKTSSRLQATFELTVAGGEFVNRKCWKRDGLDNEDAIGWFKGGLARLGVEAPGSMKEVPAVLSSLEGTFAEVTLKHQEGSDFVNVYFNKALDSDQVDVGELQQAPSDAPGEAEGEAGESKNWKVGDTVQADFNGDWYQGKVQTVNSKSRIAKVKFEDGEVHDLPFDELEPVDSGEVEAPAEETPAVAAAVLKFDEVKITPADQKKIDAVARKHDFNPDDYAEWLPLVVDLAEHCGITGDYTTCAAIVAKLEKVPKAK